jgi:hypothetical protein
MNKQTNFYRLGKLIVMTQMEKKNHYKVEQTLGGYLMMPNILLF